MCPVCKEPLVVYELEGVEIDRCLTCGGTWLDSGELEQIALLAKVKAGPLTEAVHRGGEGKHGKRRCPRCRGRLRVMHVNKVELDRCPYGQGLWFDRGELPKLIESVTEGESGAVSKFFQEMFRAELSPGNKGG